KADLELRIDGPSDKYLPINRNSTFRCTLQGPMLDDVMANETGPTWYTRGRRRITVYANELRINPDTSVGKHTHECRYVRPWLKLEKSLSFYAVDSARATTQLIFRSSERKLVYREGEPLPTIICVRSKPSTAASNATKWKIIAGEVVHSFVRDHGAPAIHIMPNRTGLVTVQCVLRDSTHCSSKLVVFLYTSE
ncbi:unnamed protein product, partial [Dicrocoelium dendriticum]